MFELLTNIKNNSSTNVKLELLNKFKNYSDENNKLLHKVLSLCYNRVKYSFGIKKIPDYTINQSEKYSLSEQLDKLEPLYTRTLTGNAGIEYLSNLLSDCTAEQSNIIIKIINRDLDCGIGIGSVSKIYDDIINLPKLLLVSPSNEKAIYSNIKFPCLAQKKEDGSRAICIKTGNSLDEINFFTRSGNVYSGLDHIKNFILGAFSNNVVLDGEMLYIDSGEISARQIGNGIVNKSIEGTISLEESIKIQYVIWDCITLEEYNTGISHDPYYKRFNYVVYSIELEISKLQYTHDNSDIKNQIQWPCISVESKTVNNLDEAKIIYRKYRDADYEGIILKDRYEIWKDYRSKKMFKFKEEIDIELEVIDVHEHSKNPELVGSMTFKSADGRIICDSGSGLKYKPTIKTKTGVVDIPLSERDPLDRELLMVRHKNNNLIGSIFTIRSNGLSNSIVERKNGSEYSLYLPRIIIERKDKNVANLLTDVFTLN